MDPITHGLLGGVVAQATGKKKYFGLATGAGILGGMMPDIDFLIRSKNHPLLLLLFHRHFTHSLLFIPVGGLLCGGLYWLIRRRKVPFWACLWAALVGYGTHGLLDASTSYGTLLLWPFSLKRIAWDIQPIISPLYSLFLFLGLALTLRTKKRWPALAALILCGIYMTGGWYQHRRAEAIQNRLAERRGQVKERGRVLPMPGTLLLWRSLYESQGRIYVDAIRILPWGEGRIWEGGSVVKFNPARVGIPRNSRLGGDISLFAWFADGYLERGDPEVDSIGDLRFSHLPQSLVPLWGIEIPEGTFDQPVRKLFFQLRSWRDLSLFWDMLKGSPPNYIGLKP